MGENADIVQCQNGEHNSPKIARPCKLSAAAPPGAGQRSFAELYQEAKCSASPLQRPVAVVAEALGWLDEEVADGLGAADQCERELANEVCAEFFIERVVGAWQCCSRLK